MTFMTGFDATLKACESLGLDLKSVPKTLLTIFYTSGVAFSQVDEMTEESRRRWRDSVVFPIKIDSAEKSKVTLHVKTEKK